MNNLINLGWSLPESMSRDGYPIPNPDPNPNPDPFPNPGPIPTPPPEPPTPPPTRPPIPKIAQSSFLT